MNPLLRDIVQDLIVLITATLNNAPPVRDRYQTFVETYILCLYGFFTRNLSFRIPPDVLMKKMVKETAQCYRKFRLFAILITEHDQDRAFRIALPFLLKSMSKRISANDV